MSQIPGDENFLSEVCFSVVDDRSLRELQRINHRFEVPGFEIENNWEWRSSLSPSLISNLDSESLEVLSETRRLTFVMREDGKPIFLSSFRITHFTGVAAQKSTEPLPDDQKFKFECEAVFQAPTDDSGYKTETVFYIEDKLFIVEYLEVQETERGIEEPVLRFRIAEMSKSLTEKNSEWIYFSFSSSLVHEVVPIQFTFKHLGENLVLICQQKLIAVVDLDTKEIIKIGARN